MKEYSKNSQKAYKLKKEWVEPSTWRKMSNRWTIRCFDKNKPILDGDYQTC